MYWTRHLIQELNEQYQRNITKRKTGRTRRRWWKNSKNWHFNNRRFWKTGVARQCDDDQKFNFKVEYNSLIRERNFKSCMREKHAAPRTHSDARMCLHSEKEAYKTMGKWLKKLLVHVEPHASSVERTLTMVTQAPISQDYYLHAVILVSVFELIKSNNDGASTVGSTWSGPSR